MRNGCYWLECDEWMVDDDNKNGCYPIFVFIKKLFSMILNVWARNF
jgi:hypothetical protein